MSFIEINGTNIFYQMIETHPCQGNLLFIHGAGWTHDVWEAQLNSLPEGFSGLALDLPSHGQSQGSYCKSIEDFALFILEFLKQIKIPRPLYLCGHSMGAAISLYIARYFPDYIDGIILIGGGARMKVYPEMLKNLSRGIINADFIRVAFAPMTDLKVVEQAVQEYLQMPPELIYHDLNACDKFDLAEELSEIEMPTLIIAGRRDRLTPVKRSRQLNIIENSVLEIVDDAGHFMMVEKTGEVNRIIADFLRTK